MSRRRGRTGKARALRSHGRAEPRMHVSKRLGCPRCGDPDGGHFCPPSLNEPGFYSCDPKGPS